MELSWYDIFKGPLRWRELFSYTIYRHAINLLTEKHIRGKLIAIEKEPLENRVRTLAECASSLTIKRSLERRYGKVTKLTFKDTLI